MDLGIWDLRMPIDSDNQNYLYIQACNLVEHRYSFPDKSTMDYHFAEYNLHWDRMVMADTDQLHHSVVEEKEVL